MFLMVDARTLGDSPSGIGLYLYSFLKEIVKEPSIKLYLLSDVDTSSEIKNIKAQGAKIILYGKKTFRSAGVFAYFRFVRQMLIQYQPDLFLEPNNLIPLPMIGFKGKTVLVIHDIFPITAPDHYGIVYQMYFRFFIKKSIRQSDLILYNSEHSRKETEAYYPRAKKVKNLVTYIIFDKPKSLDIQESENKDYFLYLGNLAKRKGTDILIKAYEKYVIGGGRRKLYLAGGINDEELLTLVEETNVRLQQNVPVSQMEFGQTVLKNDKENRQTMSANATEKSAANENEMITYLGYISNQKKSQYIANCACFLFPSRAEGFGMPIIEVMEYYRPVIASNLEIFKEIIGDAITYYPRSEDLDTETTALANAMLSFDRLDDASKQVDKKAYEDVVKRYLPEVLGKRMINSLLELQ